MTLFPRAGAPAALLQGGRRTVILDVICGGCAGHSQMQRVRDPMRAASAARRTLGHHFQPEHRRRHSACLEPVLSELRLCLSQRPQPLSAALRGEPLVPAMRRSRREGGAEVVGGVDRLALAPATPRGSRQPMPLRSATFRPCSATSISSYNRSAVVMVSA